MYSVVVGLGKTGASGVRHLTRAGGRVSVTDSRRAPPGLAELERFGDTIELRLGRFDESLLEGADQVVMSPGVSLREPIVRAARARGIEIVGDIELFARAARAPVVGITGTNGKSTVTTLVAEMAADAGCRVLAGGNLGEPALDLLAQPTPDLYVLELSSFQLDTTTSLALAAAVVLNVSADHLDRYESVDAYAAAKARIFTHAATLVLNADDPRVAAMADAPHPAHARVVAFSIAGAPAEYGLARQDGRTYLARGAQALLDVAEMQISGLHNAANALAALALGDALGLPEAAMLATLRRFGGLAHRSVRVAEIDGVRYVDDSKGTNVGATSAAVAGLAGPLVVIAGGQGKGQDFRPLAAAFRGKVRSVVLLGVDAPAIAAVLVGVCPTQAVATMQAAVRAARALAQPGDTVLLSPACASLDMFRDYKHRGDEFAAAVLALEATP